ncbi:MAG: ABC transporter permease [Coriobacteriia bacterium]|nr:ABC transporter permease [Coriobacteriia bacterium]
MGVVKRVFSSIARNRGKSILVFLIVFVLGCVISGALAVSQAVHNTDAKIRASFPALASVEIDNHALNEYVNATGGEWPEDMAELCYEVLHEIAALPHVESYELSVGGSLLSTTVEHYVPEGNQGDMHVMGDYNSFVLTGIHSATPLDISEGVIEMVQGRMFSEVELTNLSAVAIVSENFARVNGLGVGSTLSLESVVWDTRTVRDTGFDDSFFTEDNIHEQRLHDLEVVGIYVPLIESTRADQWSGDWLRFERENRIYVPNNYAREVSIWQAEREMQLFPDEEWYRDKEPDDLVWVQNVFRLHDIGDMSAFRAAVEEMTPRFYTALDAGSESLDFRSSLESLRSLSNIILAIAVTASVLILSLLITLILRERKREIGIYLALGEKKTRVIFQMMAEVSAIALIAVSLALIVGSALSANVSESMLRNELITAHAELAQRGTSVGGVLDRMGVMAHASLDQVMDAYRVSLDTTTIMLFYAVTFATILAATVLPMMYVVKLNPKKIMM